MGLSQNRYLVYIDENGSEISETSLRDDNKYLCLAAVCLTDLQAKLLRDMIKELKLFYWRQEDDFRYFHYEEFQRENYPEIFAHPEGIRGFRKRLIEIFSSIEMKIFYLFLDQRHYHLNKSLYDNKSPYYFLIEKLLMAMYGKLNASGCIDKIYIEERDQDQNKSLKIEIQKEFLSNVAKQDNSFYHFLNLERIITGENCKDNTEFLCFRNKKQAIPGLETVDYVAGIIFNKCVKEKHGVHWINEIYDNIKQKVVHIKNYSAQININPEKKSEAEI